MMSCKRLVAKSAGTAEDEPERQFEVIDSFGSALSIISEHEIIIDDLDQCNPRPDCILTIKSEDEICTAFQGTDQAPSPVKKEVRKGCKVKNVKNNTLKNYNLNELNSMSLFLRNLSLQSETRLCRQPSLNFLRRKTSQMYQWRFMTSLCPRIRQFRRILFAWLNTRKFGTKYTGLVDLSWHRCLFSSSSLLSCVRSRHLPLI